jgi:hypothetical protein
VEDSVGDEVNYLLIQMIQIYSDLEVDSLSMTESSIHTKYSNNSEVIRGYKEQKGSLHESTFASLFDCHQFFS